LPIHQREINFDPSNPASPWVPVQWCGTSSGGVYVHPANTPWCLTSDSTVLLPDGRVQQTQTYDGAGDPMWR
jgi:hypothetical protein